LLALAGSLALVPRLGTEFLPELNEGAIWVNLTLPTSVSVSERRSSRGGCAAPSAACPKSRP
jgi:cobalt-zinc-cadmium resistance protein CzcA